EAHVYPQPAWLPPWPECIEELEIPEHVIVDLVLRQASMRSVCTIHSLSEMMKIPIEVTESVFRKLNDQQYLEVRRMSGDDYVFTLSPAGRRLAAERAMTQRYAG